MNPEVPLEAMHATYNRLTNQALRYKAFERLWADFQRAGYTSADIELVIPWMQDQNRIYPDRPKSLNLHKLLDEDERARFESYRGAAETESRAKAARARAWKATPAEQARASMCGHEPVPPDTEPRMAREAVLANLDKLKAEIGRHI